MLRPHLNTVKNLLGRLPSAGQKHTFEPLCSPQFAHCESPPRWFRLCRPPGCHHATGSVHRSLPRQLGSRTALTFPWDALNARRPKSDLRVSPYRAYADLQGHLKLRNSRTRIPWRFLPPATALPFDTARPQSLASSEFWRFSSFRHDWHLWS